MAGRNLIAEIKPKGRNLLAELSPQEPPQEEGGNVIPGAIGDAFAAAGEYIPDPVSEFASSAVRGATQGIDFYSGGVNKALELMDVDARIPSLTHIAQERGIGAEGFMEPGTGREVVQAAGEIAPAVAGVAAQARGIPSLFSSDSILGRKLEELTAAGSKGANRLLTPLEVKIGTTDVAGKMIGPNGKVVADHQAREAMKQGVSQGVVAVIKRTNPKTRERMSEMIDVLERGRADEIFRNIKRPQVVAGDVLAGRLKTIKKANKSAGEAIDKAARGLASERVDATPAIQGFLDDLLDAGVHVDENLNANFVGASFQDVDVSERLVRKVFKRLKSMLDDGYSAEDVHKLKRFIDEHVTIGKNADGLAGDAERIVKGLRHRVDQVLDAKFPEYKKANDEYAETIRAINKFQDVAGRKTDLFGENANQNVAHLTRYIMGNNKTRMALLEAMDEIDDVAAKHGADTSEDVRALALMAEELEKVFPRAVRTNLAGEMEEGAKQAAREGIVWGWTGFIRAGVDKGFNKLRGINDKNAIKALKELLNRPSSPK